MAVENPALILFIPSLDLAINPSAIALVKKKLPSGETILVIPGVTPDELDVPIQFDSFITQIIQKGGRYPNDKFVVTVE